VKLIICKDEKNIWSAEKPLGVVFDFLKLRAFLAAQTQKLGGVSRLGLIYKTHEVVGGRTVVHFKNQFTREPEEYTGSVLVDATGSDRNVLMQDRYDKSQSIAATGIEFLVKVQPSDHARYAHTLTSFIGLKWMPQGYAWIFPMENNELKMGVIRYFQHDTFVPHDQSYQHYIEHLIDQSLEHKNFEILDKHGKTLQYTKSRNDVHYIDNVIAIGDAVSMVNPMAAEGIRHALVSGHYAAESIVEYLNGNKKAFPNYVKRLKKYCGLKWSLSEYVMNKIYRENNTRHFLMMSQVLRKFSFEEMMGLLFHYKTSKFMKFG